MKAIDKTECIEVLMSVAKKYEEDIALMEGIYEIETLREVEAIPISFIKKQIEKRIEEEIVELETFGEYKQMALVYAYLIDEWRKDNG